MILPRQKPVFKVETEIPDRTKTMHGKEGTRFTADLRLRERGLDSESESLEPVPSRVLQGCPEAQGHCRG